MTQSEHPFSWEALTRIVLMGVIVVLGWKALGVFPDILIAFVLAAAFYPIVKKAQRKTKMPFILCIFLFLVVPLVPFVLLGFDMIPRIAMQLPALFTSLTATGNSLSWLPASLRNFDVLAYMQAHLDYATATVNIALTLFSILTTVILTFYLIYDFERLLDLFLHVIPSREKAKIRALLEEISTVIGRYIRGNVLISAICSAIIFVGLSLIHIPFALPLAIFAGILDLLPLVGATLGAVPAVIIAFSIAPFSGVLVIILYLAYQELEKAVISPVVYDKALNLFPAVSFLSVVLGGSLFGVLGAFLALPMAASIPAIVHYQKNYKARHSADA